MKGKKKLTARESALADIRLENKRYDRNITMFFNYNKLIINMSEILEEFEHTKGQINNFGEYKNI